MHTPDPWTIDGDTIMAGGEPVAREVAERNSRLIALAPEMYEFLRDLVAGSQSAVRAARLIGRADGSLPFGCACGRGVSDVIDPIAGRR